MRGLSRNDTEPSGARNYVYAGLGIALFVSMAIVVTNLAGPTTLRIEDVDQWLPLLRNGMEAQVVQEQSAEVERKVAGAPDDKVVARIHSLGPLEGRDLQQATDILTKYEGHKRRKLRRFQERMDNDSLDDMVRQAQLYYEAETAAAALASLRAGTYFVCERPALSFNPPDTIVINAGTVKDGHRATLITVSRIKDHARLRQAKAHLEDVKAVYVGERIKAFNMLGVEGRKRLVERRKAILEAGVRATAPDREFVEKTFPAGTWLNPRTLLLHRRRGQK